MATNINLRASSGKKASTFFWPKTQKSKHTQGSASWRKKGASFAFAESNAPIAPTNTNCGWLDHL